MAWAITIGLVTIYTIIVSVFLMVFVPFPFSMVLGMIIGYGGADLILKKVDPRGMYK